jgi:hypothetical protein
MLAEAIDTVVPSPPVSTVCQRVAGGAGDEEEERERA